MQQRILLIIIKLDINPVQIHYNFFNTKNLYIIDHHNSTAGVQMGTIINGERFIKTEEVSLYPNLVGSPLYTDVQDWIDGTQSGGRITGGDLTAHSPANGKLDISAMHGFIKTTDSTIAVTKFFDLPAQTNISLTDGVTNYIYVDYNAGNPQVLVTTDRSTVRLTDQFNLGRAFREGNEVEVLTSGINRYNRDRLTHEKWIDTFGGVSYANGIIPSVNTSSYPSFTAGVLYAGSNKIDIDAVNCATTGTFESYYFNPGVSSWVETTSNVIVDYTHYNLATGGGSGLSLLTVNKYGVHWMYVCPEGNMYFLYGKGDYSLSQAQSATVSTPIPNYLNQWCKLAAKVIIRQDGSVYSTTPAWTTQFPTTYPPDHNSLADIDGGTAGQYYHITAGQYSGNVYTSSTVYGDLIYRASGNQWMTLAAGTSGYVLATQNSGYVPSWVAQTGGSVSGYFKQDCSLPLTGSYVNRNTDSGLVIFSGGTHTPGASLWLYGYDQGGSYAGGVNISVTDASMIGYVEAITIYGNTDDPSIYVNFHQIKNLMNPSDDMDATNMIYVKTEDLNIRVLAYMGL